MKLGKMMALIKNEHIKLYTKKSTIGYYIVILLVSIAFGLIVHNNFGMLLGEIEDENWKSSQKERIEDYQYQLENYADMQNVYRKEIERELAIAKYRIENDIPPGQAPFWSYMNQTTSFIGMIIMFVVVISASSVANEFSQGTIKLLVIRPYKRWKILLSKYISAFLVALEMLLCLFIINSIIGGSLFGIEGASLPFLSYVNGEVVETSMLSRLFTDYGYACVNLFMMVTFGFMISTLLRNNAVAIGLTIFLMFTGNTLVSILSAFEVDLGRYVLFSNIDLKVYTNGTEPFEGMTLGFSIAMLLVYTIIFNFITFVSFQKRDIGA